jgi:hypothetical protein
MYGSTDPECVDNGLVSPISLWWAALPFALGGFSELFINVPGKLKRSRNVRTETNANVEYSLRYRLLACARQHERSRLRHQPLEHWLRLRDQLGSLSRHH